MARFYLQLYNGAGFQPDDVGHEFATQSLAVAQAAAMAGEIIRDEVTDDMNHRLRIVVEDAERAPVAEIALTVTFGEFNKG